MTNWSVNVHSVTNACAVETLRLCIIFNQPKTRKMFIFCAHQSPLPMIDYITPASVCVWGGMCKLFVGQWHKEMYA